MSKVADCQQTGAINVMVHERRPGTSFSQALPDPASFPMASRAAMMVRGSRLDTRAAIAVDGGGTTSLFGIVPIYADVSAVNFNTDKSLLERNA